MPSYLQRLARQGRSSTDGSAQCVEPSKSVPGQTPVVIVIVVLVLAAALVGEGRPVAVILQLLAGAGLIGTEVARRIIDVRE